MNLYEKIKELAKQKQVSIRQVEEKLGFGNGTLNRWRTVTPSADKVRDIADYFHVSVDYLLGRTNFKNHSDILNKVENLNSSTEEFFDLVEILNANTPDEVKRQDLQDFTVLNSFSSFTSNYETLSSNQRWHIANGITLLHYAIHELNDDDIEKLGKMLKTIHSFLISSRGFPNNDDDIVLKELAGNNPFKDLIDLEKIMINFIDE